MKLTNLLSGTRQLRKYESRGKFMIFSAFQCLRFVFVRQQSFAVKKTIYNRAICKLCHKEIRFLHSSIFHAASIWSISPWSLDIFYEQPQYWDCFSGFCDACLDGTKLIDIQYGQFFARSTHKSLLMQFICNWISRDMLRSGWCVDGKILFHCCFLSRNRNFFVWSTEIAFSLRARNERKNCCWCCVTFTVYVLHFQQDDVEFAELLFTCSWQIWNRSWRV